MHASLRNDLTIEMSELFKKPDILQQLGPTRPGSHYILIVCNRATGIRCKFLAHIQAPWYKDLVAKPICVEKPIGSEAAWFSKYRIK